MLRAEERGSGAVGLGFPGLLPLSLPHPHPLPGTLGQSGVLSVKTAGPTSLPFYRVGGS